MILAIPLIILLLGFHILVATSPHLTRHARLRSQFAIYRRSFGLSYLITQRCSLYLIF